MVVEEARNAFARMEQQKNAHELSRQRLFRIKGQLFNAKMATICLFHSKTQFSIRHLETFYPNFSKWACWRSVRKGKPIRTSTPGRHRGHWGLASACDALRLCHRSS